MSGDWRDQEISLGPLFPRPIAALLTVVVTGACWVLPLISSADLINKILAVSLGSAFLAVFYIPRLGIIRVDSCARTIEFREGLTAGVLHLWRRRETRQVTLPPGSTVVIGEWLDANAFATLGIKRHAPDGSLDVLLQQKFAFNKSSALRLASSLRQIAGLKVRTVRLDDQFKKIDLT